MTLCPIDNQTIQPDTNSFTFLGKINFNDISTDDGGYEMVYYTETNSNSFALRLNKALDITLPGEMPNYSLLQANVDGVYVTSNDFGELSNNTWYNIAVVVDQENDLLKLVINSQTYTVGLDINEIIFESNNYGLELGRHYWSNGAEAHYFDGYFDDFSFWEYALTNEQIIEYQNCELNGDEAGLLAYWNFNSDCYNNCSEIEDISGNNNNGTVQCNSCDEIYSGGPSFNSEIIPELNCTDDYGNVNSSNIIGDLNCDEVINQLDLLILSNLILEIGESPQLQEMYPCLNENLNGLDNNDIESLQEITEIFQSINPVNSNIRDFDFPEGFRGSGVVIDFSEISEYVVDDGKHLYITSSFINSNPKNINKRCCNSCKWILFTSNNS